MTNVIRSEEGYLCFAWGESDKPIARLCHTRDEVLQFFVDEWFGEKPEDMHPDNRNNWDEVVAEFDGEWDMVDELQWTFEIGGVRVHKCFFYPAPTSAIGGVSVPDASASDNPRRTAPIAQPKP